MLRVLGTIAPPEYGLTQPVQRSATSTSTVPTTISPSTVQPGYYVDEQSGPSYVLVVTTIRVGLSGWMFFVYMDGHTSEAFHFHSTFQSGGAIVIVTDTTSQPFPDQNPSRFPQSGAQAIPAGHTYRGAFHFPTLTFPGCSTYLYWANPTNTTSPVSCSFTYHGTSIGG